LLVTLVALDYCLLLFHYISTSSINFFFFWLAYECAANPFCTTTSAVLFNEGTMFFSHNKST
jgi:hypothetical protein